MIPDLNFPAKAWHFLHGRIIPRWMKTYNPDVSRYRITIREWTGKELVGALGDWVVLKADGKLEMWEDKKLEKAYPEFYERKHQPHPRGTGGW